MDKIRDKIYSYNKSKSNEECAWKIDRSVWTGYTWQAQDKKAGDQYIEKHKAQENCQFREIGPEACDPYAGCKQDDRSTDEFNNII